MDRMTRMERMAEAQRIRSKLISKENEAVLINALVDFGVGKNTGSPELVSLSVIDIFIEKGWKPVDGHAELPTD